MALDVTDATFEEEVLARSESAPVVVDLWAPWCGPCRTLGPIIEKVVDARDGAVVLAKANVDENPRISATFQVQSIPAVFALHRRQVIDRFVGALPEREVEAFIERVLARAQPTEVDLLIDAGDEASLRAVLESEPANERAITALARLLVERGDGEEALALLERIPETGETRRLAALARTGEDGPAGDIDERIPALLARVPGDEEARREIVDLIETLPQDDPRRESYRRALSAKLF